MSEETHVDRRKRLQKYAESMHSLGVHKDTHKKSIYAWFALWEDGGDGFDTKIEALHAVKKYANSKAYHVSEYGPW